MSKKTRFETSISSDIKKQWDSFILNKHHHLKGVYGPELELALIQYIQSYSNDNNNDVVAVSKNTLMNLKTLSMRFRDMPQLTIRPAVLRGAIKSFLDCKDHRTLEKYVGIVMSHSKNELLDGEIFPVINVEGFCRYVDKLSHDAAVTRLKR